MQACSSKSIFEPPVKFPQALLSVNNLLMPVMCQAGIRQCSCSLPAFPSVIPRCEWAISTWLLIGPLRGQMGQSPSMTLNKRGHFMGDHLLSLFSLSFEWGCTGLGLEKFVEGGKLILDSQYTATCRNPVTLHLFTVTFHLYFYCSSLIVVFTFYVRRIRNTALYVCDVDSGWTYIIMGCNYVQLWG